MLRTTAVVVVLAALAAPAAAERQPVVTGKLGGGVASIADAEPGTEPDGMTAFGLSVSWEDGPLPYPDKPGYAARGELVPELQVMRMSFDRGRTGEQVDVTSAITAGVRLQVALSQREMGLLKVSARASAFLGVRLGVVADADRTRVIGGGLGERIWLGDRYQLGVELDVLRFQGQEEQLVVDVPGATARELPWTPRDADYTSVGALLTLGGFL